MYKEIKSRARWVRQEAEDLKQHTNLDEFESNTAYVYTEMGSKISKMAALHKDYFKFIQVEVPFALIESIISLCTDFPVVSSSRIRLGSARYDNEITLGYCFLDAPNWSDRELVVNIMMPTIDCRSVNIRIYHKVGTFGILRSRPINVNDLRENLTNFDIAMFGAMFLGKDLLPTRIEEPQENRDSLVYAIHYENHKPVYVRFDFLIRATKDSETRGMVTQISISHDAGYQYRSRRIRR